MIFASVPVIEPPDQLRDNAFTWNACGPELLIVDNTPNYAWEAEAKKHGWSYCSFAKNLGVPAAWNIARAKFMAEAEHDDDLLLLFSSSLYFETGLAETMDRMQAAANWKGCQTRYGFHSIAWSKRVFELCGNFDENFWIGYLGDNDWARRLIVEEILLAGEEAMPSIEIAAPKPPDGRAINTVGLISNTAACSDYYARKWGGEPSQETFPTPFDSGLPTSWWSPIVRMGMENVNLGETHYR